MLGAIIGAGASFLGGMFNRSNQNEINAANIAANERNNNANIAAQERINQLTLEDKARDRELQKEFAQTGIRWKSEDAKAAGIHPLYAMGANTVSYAPSAVGLTAPKSEAPTLTASNSFGDSLASAGQDISRAVTASATEETRQVNAVSQRLSLQNASLQNELLATQIAKLRAQVGPAQPALVSVDGNRIKDKELESTAEAIPETRKIRAAGIPLQTNPYFSDAESGENRYGELGEALTGAINLPADIAFTLYKNYPWLLDQLKKVKGGPRPGQTPGLE